MTFSLIIGDRRSRGIFPKGKLKNVLRDFPESRKMKKRLSGFSRRQKNKKTPFGIFPKGKFKISLQDFPERNTSSMTLCKIAPRMVLKTENSRKLAPRMALKNGNPDKKLRFLCTTGRRAHFLDRDRRSRGIFPKDEFKNSFRENNSGFTCHSSDCCSPGTASANLTFQFSMSSGSLLLCSGLLCR